MQRHFPKTRRTFGLILLQFVLLIAQLIYYFSKGEVAKEPVLSYVYNLMNILIFQISVEVLLAFIY